MIRNATRDSSGVNPVLPRTELLSDHEFCSFKKCVVASREARLLHKIHGLANSGIDSPAPKMRADGPFLRQHLEF